MKEHTFRGHSDSVDQLTWHPSHPDQLATASGDKTVRLWDARSQKLAATLNTKGAPAEPAVPNVVTVVCWDHYCSGQFQWRAGPMYLTFRVIEDVPRFRVRRETVLDFLAGENINISWSPNGQTIAVGNKEDLVSFIDVRQRRILRDEQFRFEVNEISWNRRNTLFFMTSGSGHIVVLRWVPEAVGWDSREGAEVGASTLVALA